MPNAPRRDLNATQFMVGVKFMHAHGAARIQCFVSGAVKGLSSLPFNQLVVVPIVITPDPPDFAGCFL